MKTTIEIPDALYKRVKIHAVEHGSTLKQVVLSSLERELSGPNESTAKPQQSYWANRQLTPEFRKYWESTDKPTGTDSTTLISEDRDGR